MKKIISFLILLVITMQAHALGDFVFSFKLNENEGQVRFNSQVTDNISSGENAVMSWLVKTPRNGFSILLNGVPVSSQVESSHAFQMAKSGKIKIGLFDFEKNRVVEEHEHYIAVSGDPVITSLTVDKEIVATGTNVTLYWEGENLGKVTFDKDLRGIYESSAIAKVNSDITFTMTATSPSGKTDTASVSVKVGDYIPEITSMNISTTDVYLGDKVTIDWTSKDTESVDLYVDGQPLSKGHPIDGSLEYILDRTGDIRLGLRPKDKYYGLYGEVESVQLKVKESSNWDLSPTITTKGSVGAGQKINIVWAAGERAESVSARYYTDASVEWVSLPINQLSGEYDLIINDDAVRKITIEFNQTRKDGGIVTKKLIGSLIVASIDKEEVSKNSSVVISAIQGVNYPIYFYVNGEFVRSGGDGSNTIALKDDGENKINVYGFKGSSEAIASFSVNVLPDWTRTPDVDRPILFEGDEFTVAWSIPKPFTKASLVKKTSSGAIAISLGDFSASDSYRDALGAGENSIEYTVVAETESGVTYTKKAYAYLLNASTSVAQVSFGQKLNLDYLSSTPDKKLYVDGQFIKNLSGSTTSIGELSIGKRLIEIKSTFGKNPSSNRVWSKEIDVIPSNNIVISVEHLLVDVGSTFKWSWYAPDIYETVTVTEGVWDGYKKTSSTKNAGELASIMTSKAYNLIVTGKTKDGTSSSKVITLYPITLICCSSEILDERVTYSLSSSYAPGTRYVNGRNKGDARLTQWLGNYEFNYGLNELRFFFSTSQYQKEYIFEINKIRPVSISAINNAVPVGDGINFEWDAPADYATVSAKLNGVEFSTSSRGTHSVTADNVATYTLGITGKTAKGKTSSVSKSVYSYSVEHAKEVNEDQGLSVIVNSTGIFNVNYSVGGNTGVIANNKAQTIPASHLKEGLNEILFTPALSNSRSFTTTVNVIEKPKVEPVTNFDVAPSGTMIALDWDIPTDYLNVQVHERVGGQYNLISTANAGHHEMIKSDELIDYFYVTAKSLSGATYSKTLEVHLVDVISPDEIINDGPLTYSLTSRFGANEYVNGRAINTRSMSGSYSLLSSEFNEGENIFEVIPRGSLKPKSFIKKVTKIGSVNADFVHNVMPSGHTMVFNWDLPSNYTDVKIELNTGSGYETVSTNGAGSHSGQKSENNNDSYRITAKTASGTLFQKTYLAYKLNAEINETEVINVGPQISISGSYGADIYINDVKHSSIGPNGGLTIPLLKLNPGANKINVKTSLNPGSSPDIIFTVNKLADPIFDVDYLLAPSGESIGFNWSVSDEYQFAELELNLNGAKTTVSNGMIGSSSFIKSSGFDYISLKVTSKNGKTGTYSKSIKAINIGQVATEIAKTQTITVSVDIPNATNTVFANVYIDDNLYTTMSTGKKSFDLKGQHLSVGEHVLKIKPLDSMPDDSIMEYMQTIKVLPDFDFSGVHELYLVGETVRESWSVPDEYNVELRFYDNYKAGGYQVVSTDNTGSFEYEKLNHQQALYIYATTNKGAYVAKAIHSYALSASLSSESILSETPLLDLSVGYWHTAEVYINGIKRYTFSDRQEKVNFPINLGFFSLGNNEIEIIPTFTDPSWTGQSWKKTVYRHQTPSAKNEYLHVAPGHEANFFWSFPDNFTNRKVEVSVDGVRKTISAEKEGTYSFTKSSVTDSIYVSGDIEGEYVTTQNSISTLKASISSDYVAYNGSVEINLGINSRPTPKVYINGNHLSSLNLINDVTATIVSSYMQDGDNEIVFDYQHSTIKNYRASVYKYPRAFISYNGPKFRPVGSSAEFSWDLPDAYSAFSQSYIRASGQATVASTQSGTYSFDIEMNQNSMNASLTYPGGIYKIASYVHGYDVIIPSSVVNENLAIQYLTAHTGFDVYINGIKRHSEPYGHTANKTIAVSNAFLNDGDNDIEVVPTHPSYINIAESWKGVVKKVPTPPATISSNYSLVHLGDIAEFSWNVPNTYTDISITTKKGSGNEIEISNSATGTHGYLKEEGTDILYVTMRNDEGAYKRQGIELNSFSVLVPATITTEDAAFTFTASKYQSYFDVYVNSIKRYSAVSSSASFNGILDNAFFDEGANEVIVVPTNPSLAGKGKPWTGVVIKK